MSGIVVSAVTAYSAHREWALRPPDERYASVNALYQAARARRERAQERDIATAEFRTEAVDDVLVQHGSWDRTVPLPPWVFGRLAKIGRAPQISFGPLPAAIAS